MTIGLYSLIFLMKMEITSKSFGGKMTWNDKLKT